MPIYEYLCSRCGLKFEALKAMSQAREGAVCPGCGGNAERVLSRFCHTAEGSESTTGGSSCSSCTATSCSSCSLAS